MTTAAASNDARAKPPISTHPWFPAIVGLWCAALLGLSSLAVPPEMLERIVVATGLPKLFAAAAPPLGPTARLLIALGLSTVGEIGGIVLGRRLGARHRVEPGRQHQLETAVSADTDVGERRARDAHPDAPPRKPFSPAETVDETESVLLKRTLASETEAEPRDLCDVTPLPGAAMQPHHSAPQEIGQDAEPFDAPRFDPPAPETKLELTACATPGSAKPERSQAPFRTGIATAPLETLGIVQLSERLALAMQARRERLAQRSAPVFEMPVARPSASEADAHSAGSFAAQPVEGDDQPEPEAVAPELAHGLEILARRAPRCEPGSEAAGLQPDPAEADRALRAALASLQRISGAR